jgi:8-oxo-dGTP pyrophosphatase MutT (NUDIX family)
MSKVNAAGIFIVRKDKTLLVCHPTNHAPTFWSIPKGKVDDGETMFQAAIRETHEETNLYLQGSHDFDVYVLNGVDYSHGKKKLWPYLFNERESSVIDWIELNKTIKCNSNVSDERGDFPEMDGYKWVTLADARGMLHETQSACLDRIIELTK